MARKKKLRATLTEETLREYVDLVYKIGRQRQVNFGSKFSPADFAAGAAAVFQFLQCGGLMPAAWALMNVTGQNPFEVPDERGKEPDKGGGAGGGKRAD